MRPLVRLLLACTISAVTVLSLSSAALAIDEFPAPGNPSGLTAGPDGAIWFTEEAGNNIGRMTTAGVVTHEFPIPTAGSLPSEIAVGPDGLLWFTEFNGNKVGRVNANGTITEFALSGNPDGIVAGPDGLLWVARSGSDQISKVNTSGVVAASYSVGNEPGDIAVGPDGRLWFTEGAGNAIGAITTAGSFIDFTIPTPASDPSGITATGGALWFTEFAGNKIGRISTTGQITEFAAGSGEPSGIATGSDGALWFTETGPNIIGRMSTGGTLTNEFNVPTTGSQPGAIAPGPDGALWFAEFAASKIGRIATAPPFVPPPPPPPAPATPTVKKCKVPKLKGLTVRKARQKLKKAGCKYKIRGKGRVRSTVPKAGRTTTKRVTVRCKAKRKKAKRSVASLVTAQAAVASGSASHSGHELSDAPQADAIGVNHFARTPRRNNRRLRAPGGTATYSGLARDGTRAAAVSGVELDGIRRKTKRALMRRLISVRGGLQA
jgi:virginiamycin B lyase